MIGKGGLPQVYKILSRMFAVKRVLLDRTDQETVSGYMNEISLPKRLEGNHRIIRFIDSEVKAGPDCSQGHLALVMELGKIGVYIAMAQNWELTALLQIWHDFCTIS